MTLLTFDGVSCAAPDGTILFSDLTFALNRETVGLVGRNGSGKSTLLNLIASGERPHGGTIRRGARIGLLRQLPDNPDATLAEALGAADALARLARIEAGVVRAGDLERADWALPARLDQVLADTGLSALDPGRSIATLSGGERTRLMLAALVLPEPEVLLLDEPTNNLDAAGREAVADLLAGWPGGAIIASHDRELLVGADRIVELTSAGIRIVGGGWDVFEERRASERALAASALARSEAAVARANREAQRELEKQARRDKRGRAVAAAGGDPKILLGARRQRAEETAGRYRKIGDELAERALADLADARAHVERVTPVRIHLPPSGLAAGHVLVRAENLSCRRGGRELFSGLDLIVRGPDRIALKGPNGSGKSSLLALLLGRETPSSGTLSVDADRVALLDQDLDLLDGEASLEAEIRRHNPGLLRQDARAALAAFGFRNKWAARAVASLSGGERVRLALACLFSRAVPPQMLLLDEPTNHLDLDATALLERALANWDGAILCVSHDTAFLAGLGIEREIVLG